MPRTEADHPRLVEAIHARLAELDPAHIWVVTVDETADDEVPVARIDRDGTYPAPGLMMMLPDPTSDQLTGAGLGRHAADAALRVAVDADAQATATKARYGGG